MESTVCIFFQTAPIIREPLGMMQPMETESTNRRMSTMLGSGKTVNLMEKESKLLKAVGMMESFVLARNRGEGR